MMTIMPSRFSLLLCTTILILILHAAIADPSTIVWYGTPEAASYVGNCQELCCCPVCGVPTNDAFPYGLTEASVQLPFPKVRGSSCHFSIWSDRAYNDSNAQPVTVPNTLFWTNYSVFLDYVTHTAPISCDCCKFSGIDTSCKETIPTATYPRYFFIQGGLAIERGAVNLRFMEGAQLNYTDVVELRNDTYCGYTVPRPVLHQTNLTILNSTYTSQLNITRLPSRGCYKVCYYASSLTTPQWYDLGYLTVLAKAAPVMSYLYDEKDILLAGNKATLTFFGLTTLSVFSDVAELRATGTCGAANPSASTATGTNGNLDVISGTEWCKPAVKAAITTQRPLNYIAIKYTDCGVTNRVYQARTQWSLTFPVSASDVSYTICYRTNGSWYSVGSTTIRGQQTAMTALNALYTATNGAYWKRNANWGGIDPCTYYGVRCSGTNVVALYLGRNNLTGTLPESMFRAPYFSTLRHVALDMNNLYGTIPRSMGSMIMMEFLDLGFNNFSGTLPDTLDRTALYITYAGNNQLRGYTPESIENIGLTWTSYGNNLTDTPDPLMAPGCPVDITECSERGSRDYGTTQCGPDGVTEGACKAYGCCFNAQAPLTFGGTACFTRRRVTYQQYPPCQQLACHRTLTSE